MKRLLIYAAFAFMVFSCANGGDSNNGDAEDATSPASGASGEGSGNDTTGINAAAAFPVDSSVNARPIGDVPGADKSKLSGDTTTDQ